MSVIDKIKLDGTTYDVGKTPDTTPTQGSTNAVSSGGVYSALDTLQAETNKRLDIVDFNFNVLRVTSGNNLINERVLADANGISFNGSEYIGTALTFHKEISRNNPISVDVTDYSTRYTLSLEAYTEATDQSNSGLSVFFLYDDGSNGRISISNSITEYKRFSLVSTSDLSKHIVGVYFSYGNNGDNVWHIRKMMLNKGIVAEDYVPYYTAHDITARENIDNIENKISAIEPIIKNLVNDVNFIAPSTGTHYVEYSFTAGKTYEITPTAGITINTMDSSNKILETQALFINRVNTFVCTQSAVKFSFWSKEGITVYINEVGTVTDTAYKNADKLFYLTDGVPEYFNEQLETGVTKIRELMGSSGRNGDAFIFITDLHWSNNAKNSPYLVKHILDNSNVPLIICGGDLITQGEREKMIEDMTDCVKSFDFQNHFFPVAFGNHDDNWNGWNNQHDYPERYFDVNMEYALMGKQCDGHITWLTDYDMSFFFDNPATKTRYIVLDTGDDGNTGTGNRTFTAVNELANVMLNVEQDWHIVVVAHIVTYGKYTTVVEPMMDAYNNRGTYDTFDFANAKGVVVMGIGGHTHADSNHVTTGGIPIIVTSCDTKDSKAGATAGTITEQCFDVVVMNYTNKVIDCIRIGRGSDRNFTY